MFDAEAFEAWFVHDKLILDLLTPAENQDLMLRLPGPAADLPEARRRRAFEEALASFFARVDVPSLDVQHMRGTLSRGQLVWFEQAIAFKGVAAARSSIAEGKPGNATYSAAMSTDKDFRVRSEYNVERLTCSSAGNQLSGTRRQFILGYVQEVDETGVDLRTIAIASRWQRPAPDISDWYSVEPGRVWPSSVDQFADVDFPIACQPLS